METDAAGIVYFSNIPAFFDESFIAAMRTKGIFWDKFDELQFLIPIVEQKTSFKGPLKPGDIYTTHMAVVDQKDRSFTSNHIITKEIKGQASIIASGYISRVVVDNQSFNPKTIPDLLKQALDSFSLDLKAWDEYVNAF